MTTYSINLYAKGTGRVRDPWSRSLKTSTNPQLEASYRAARTEAGRAAGPVIKALFALLSSPRRRAIHAVSAYFRHVHATLARAGTVEERYAARLALEEDLPEIFAGRPIGQKADWIPAFADSVERFALPRHYFEDMIKGVCLEAEPGTRLGSWRDLREYCYYTGGSLGLITSRILDLRDERGEESAVCLGVAMQLTRIARDVGQNLREGKIYLPQSELREFGVSEADLRAGHVSPEYRDMMAFQLDRARSYYTRAEEGIPLLGSLTGRLSAWLARYLYAGLHGQIERRGYNTLGRRLRTDLSTKLALCLRALGEVIRPRPLDPGYFRHGDVELTHVP